MIHVLCLNPAIDKLFEIDGFTAGEDYPGQTPRVAVGGKGVNVARVLSQLGEDVRLYAFLGEDGGEAVRREMTSRCSCVFVPVPGACRTTINILDRAGGRETVITEAGPRADGEQTRRLLAALDRALCPGDMVCCSGSIIPGAPEDFYAAVSRMAKAAGAHCALDCNARTLPPSLKGASYALAKPNERELAALTGRARTQDARALCAMAREGMPQAERVLVSMGAAGGVLLAPEGAWRASLPPVRVISSVGSGDATFAGALSALVRGMDGETTLRLAMACGVTNAALGGNGSIERQELERVMENITVEALSDKPA